MYTIGVIQYYATIVWTWLTQYVTYLYDQFMGFSAIIKIAAVSVTLSVMLMAYTLAKLFFTSMIKRKWNKTYDKMDKRYGDGIRYILSAEAGGDLTPNQIIEILDLDNDKAHSHSQNYGNLLKTYRDKLSFARLVYNCRISDKAALGRKKNLHILLRLFDMQNFIEGVINKGSLHRKSEALVMLRAFKLPLNQWIANQLRTSKRYRLRRMSQYASIMTSSNADLEYFESDFFDKHCCMYDEINLGYVLHRRVAMKRKLPNLAQLALVQTRPSTQAMFIRQMRHFNQTEYCSELEDLFQRTDDREVIQEISRTWGYLHYTDGEPLLQEIVLTHHDDTKVATMHALARMCTGRSLETLVEGYRNSGDAHVKYEALRCIHDYGAEGLLKFKELEMKAPEEEKYIFEFFKNDITAEDTTLEQDDIYDQHGVENLFSVE